MKVAPQLPPAPCRILFIGEAPRDEETIKGHHLIGSDGFLLAQALRAARLTSTDDLPAGFMPSQRRETARLLWERREHGVTCVFDTPIPVGTHQKLGKFVKENPERVQMALARLTAEIEACRPNLIVPLGAVALWALTGNASIENYRGAIGVATCLSPGTKILPTYAPFQIRTTYKLLYTWIADLAKARRESETSIVSYPKREIWLEPTHADLEKFRELYIRPDTGPLSVDIETGGGHISCLSFSPSAWRSIIIPFVDYRRPDRRYWPDTRSEVRAWEFVRAVLADESIPKLFQNGGAFDIFMFLDQQGISVINYSEDLRLVHKTLWPELKASLGFIGASWGSAHSWKAGVSHWDASKRDS